MSKLIWRVEILNQIRHSGNRFWFIVKAARHAQSSYLLRSLPSEAAVGEPVFTSRKKRGHLTEVQVNRIVKAAALRVPGLEPEVAASVSPHWLRHAHASHAILSWRSGTLS